MHLRRKQAVVAFHKWRHSQLRSQYRKRVEDILETVSEEDLVHDELKRRHGLLEEKQVTSAPLSHRTSHKEPWPLRACRCGELAAANARLSVEQRSTQLLLEQSEAGRSDLERKLRELEETARC